jgi:hypothetical protein
VFQEKQCDVGFNKKRRIAMSQQNEGLKCFTAGEALEMFRRVKLSGVTVVYSDGGEAYIGVTQEKVASGDPVTVMLKTTGKTFIMISEESLSAGAALYGAADGKVKDTASGTSMGTALEAASGDGEEIEVLPA